MSNPWFRLYSEFASDHKMQMMSEAYQRRYVMLLCLRCSNGDVTLQDEEVAFQLRISNDEWEQTKAVFIDKKLIDKCNRVLAWEKRQFLSDSSTERVRKHRDKVKQEGNVTVTPPDTDTEQIQNRTDKKNITTKKPKVSVSQDIECPVDVSSDVWSDFLQARRVKKAPLSETALKGIRREANKAGWSMNAALQEICARGWTGFNAAWVSGIEPRKTEYQKRQDATTEALFGSNPFASTLKTVEAEVINATEAITHRLG